LPEFKELLSLEGGLYGKEEALITSARQNDKAMRDALDKEFMYTLVGYGTLMNGNETMNELKSTLQKAGTRIKDIEAEFRARVTPVWVLAFKRVFNKIATRRKWETEEDVAASRVAVLNISGSMNHKFNGVAIKLTENEYLAIREREKNYGIIGLKYVYDYRTGTRLKEKCICVKSNPLKSDVTVSRRDRLEFYRQRLLKYSYGLDPDRLLKTNKMPIPRYIETIDIGVKLLDGLLGTVGMYDNYLKTTYCYYISRDEKKDYGEITLERYYRIIGMEIAQELHAAS
ncbi:MAG: hypothetical protein KJ709_06980, partial [Nanoarchaeota archaeon]|nr:hypothetical protein [Nanoarchaeota archaeon]